MPPYIFTSRISDIRESPTKPLAVALRDSGCNVFAWDPYVSIENRPTDFTEWVDEPKDAEADVVVICTAHQEVINIDWKELRNYSEIGLIYDGRRVLNEHEMVSHGWKFTAIGKP